MKNKSEIKKLAHIGAGGQKGWIFSVDGIVGALPATQYKDPAKIVVTEKVNNERKQCIKDWQSV